jgi:dynein heavy chain
MEQNDLPAAFGQHTNAEITSQIMDTNELLYSILSLQPAVVSSEGGNAEQKILELIAQLREGIPNSIDVNALKHKTRADDSPLTVVLIQEVQRYNILLDKLRTSLDQLDKGIKGFVVISPELEDMMGSLNQNVVP